MEIDDIFVKASSHARSLKDVSEDDMLKLYGLYKQAHEGPCTIAKPYFWDFTAKAKWSSWMSMKDVSSNDAKIQYVDLVKNLDPLWDDNLAVADPLQKSTSGGMGICVSTLNSEVEEEIEDRDKTIFDWCKDGNLKRIMKLVDEKNAYVHDVDEEKLSLLHWSVDRGFLEISEYLIKNGCDVNSLDVDLQTPLHYAAVGDHAELIELLLHNGADEHLKDIDGNTPVECTDSSDIKSFFSKYLNNSGDFRPNQRFVLMCMGHRNNYGNIGSQPKVCADVYGAQK